MSDLLVGVLFAAFHAISMSMNGALWEIGNRPEIQTQLREELRLAKSYPDISPYELNKLPFLNNFVMEVLR